MKIKGNENFLKESIAEAKIIRETAIENAKRALEESFTPKIQSMMAARLQEMEDLEEDTLEEITDDTMEFMSGEEDENHQAISEEELDALLAELDQESSISEDEIFEAKSKDKDKDKDKDEDKKSAKKDDSKKDEEISLDGITPEELKSLIKDAVAEVMDGANDSLDAPVDDFDETDSFEEAPVGDDFGMEEKSEEEMSLDEILAEIEALENKDALEEKRKSKKEDDSTKKMMQEIASLKNELMETNLLNAKLHFATKVFKTYNLSNDQKVKILEHFDKVSSPKEAKLVFETLNESLENNLNKSKKFIKESFGLSSKPVNAVKKEIVEVDDTIKRFQKLAGL
jgi:hypothetical protein